MRLLGLLVPYKKPKWQISPQFHLPQLAKSLPFHVPEAWKRYPGPFMAEPPRKGHFLGSTPQGFPGESGGSSLKETKNLIHGWIQSIILNVRQKVPQSI